MWQIPLYARYCNIQTPVLNQPTWETELSLLTTLSGTAVTFKSVLNMTSPYLYEASQSSVETSGTSFARLNIHCHHFKLRTPGTVNKSQRKSLWCFWLIGLDFCVTLTLRCSGAQLTMGLGSMPFPSCLATSITWRRCECKIHLSVCGRYKSIVGSHWSKIHESTALKWQDADCQAVQLT